MTLITPDDYFNLRRQSDGLKIEASRFEGIPWSLSRTTGDGWRLNIYRVEGDVEVCIISPDGRSKTFS